MNNKINCPVCSANRWHKTGTRKQKITDSRWKYGYPKIQKYVFFNIWHPNKSIVEMERCVCKKCGLVVDSPRPDEKDIARKYQYLSRVEKNLGSAKGISKKAMKQEYRQAKNILKLSESQIKCSSESLDILDFGGGDGHFLIPMKNKGHNCYLVDYNRYPVAGIVRLGDTLKDIPKNYRFDFIVCRHVLEHVAYPRKLIASFKKYMKNQSIVYAEVPIQLYRAPKPNGDPVTHINFFQEKSFQILFESVGFKTIISRKKPMTYHGEPKIVAQILAQKGYNKRNVSYYHSYNKTMSLIKLSFFSYYKARLAAHPIEFGISIIKRAIKKIKILIKTEKLVR